MDYFSCYICLFRGGIWWAFWPRFARVIPFIFLWMGCGGQPVWKQGILLLLLSFELFCGVCEVLNSYISNNCYELSNSFSTLMFLVVTALRSKLVYLGWKARLKTTRSSHSTRTPRCCWKQHWKVSMFLQSAKWVYTSALAATILSQAHNHVAKIFHNSMFIAWMILVYTVLWMCFCAFQTQVQ